MPARSLNSATVGKNFDSRICSANARSNSSRPTSCRIKSHSRRSNAFDSMVRFADGYIAKAFAIRWASQGVLSCELNDLSEVIDVLPLSLFGSVDRIWSNPLGGGV